MADDTNFSTQAYFVGIALGGLDRDVSRVDSSAASTSAYISKLTVVLDLKVK